MKTEKHTSRIRRIIGDILLVLTVLLTADVVIVMLHKISTVVLKAKYQEVFQYELILCAVLLLFALDVRFNLFTRSKQMILEDQAESTKDNFRNTALIIDPGKPVVLISSNYHMDRAVQTAESAGFSNVLRLPAPSSLFSYGANVMNEVILELNELTFRK